MNSIFIHFPYHSFTCPSSYMSEWTQYLYTFRTILSLVLLVICPNVLNICPRPLPFTQSSFYLYVRMNLIFQSLYVYWIMLFYSWKLCCIGFYVTIMDLVYFIEHQWHWRYKYSGFFNVECSCLTKGLVIYLEPTILTIRQVPWRWRYE